MTNSATYRRLRIYDRVLIAARARDGFTTSEIAAELGFSRSTVWRELRRGVSSTGLAATGGYDPAQAQLRADANRGRKKRRLDEDPELASSLVETMERKRTVRQALHLLRAEGVGGLLSHEAVYAWIFAPGGDRALKERARTAMRRPRRHKRCRTRGSVGAGQIPNMVLLATRPEEAQGRLELGHFEGDLVMGKAGRGALISLVDRKTRYTFLRQVPDKTAQTVTDTLVRLIGEAGGHDVVKTITWDRGRELTTHEKVTLRAGVPVYFCDPHSPWQRPTNENTNGVVRWWFPKGAVDFRGLREAQVAKCQDWLNSRPMPALSWASPAEVFAQEVVALGS